jgi:hypothetical protein
MKFEFWMGCVLRLDLGLLLCWIDIEIGSL